MGIQEFLRRGVRELMIARDDSQKREMFYKYSDENIPKYAQVTVDADEVAVLFQDGRIVGKLGPGRHTLETSSNLPFLNSTVKEYTGGNVFKTEIIFVLTIESPGVPFSGSIGTVEDPKSGAVAHLMASGEFSIKVVDPIPAIVELVGMCTLSKVALLSWFSSLFIKHLRQEVSGLIVKKKIPLFDVTSGAYVEEIEEAVLKKLHQTDIHGIRIQRFGDFHISISVTDGEIKDLYNDKAHVEMAGGVGEYQQFGMAKVLVGAGEAMAQGNGGAVGLFPAAVGTAAAFGIGSQGVLKGSNYHSQSKTVDCTHCKAQVPAGRFCSVCGTKLLKSVVQCRSCNAQMGQADKFCTRCGAQR